MWNDGEVSAISHRSRKVLEVFEIPQVPDESFRMQSMVGSDLCDHRDCHSYDISIFHLSHIY